MMNSAVVTINGAALSYTDSGSGAPIVAVHGALSDQRIWHPYVPLLSRDSRFIAYTQRYFGPDTWPDAGEHFSREVHIADLISFVETLDAGPVHLVTWSYGGDIGTCATMRRADLFRSAVHFDPSVGTLLDDIPRGRDAQAEFISALEPALTALGDGDGEAGAFAFAEAMSALPPGSAAREPASVRSMFRDNARTLIPFLQLPPGAPVDAGELAAVETPTLVVRGEYTYTRYKLIAAKLVSLLPRARLAILPGARHDGPHRQPAAFARMIRRFHRIL